ncbi:Ankyrin repeat family protein [Euphorbia peplus]|nr:Ankyrin repeat family protein [Euphorbia peplus]
MCIEDTINGLELYKAALSNEWKKAESIYEKPGTNYGDIITSRGETALHVAALAGHSDFVENLIDKMMEHEIQAETKTNRENGRGNTAFHCAAISGNVSTAKSIMKCKLDHLPMIRGDGDYLPIDMAALKGNKEMVRYLYQSTKHHLQDPTCQDLDDQDRKTLLVTLINSDIYDVAFEMAKAILSHGTTPENMEEEALKVLALKPLNPPGFLQKFIPPFSYKHVVAKRVMYNNAVELIQILWDKISSDINRVSNLMRFSNQNPVLDAAKMGNFQFLSILIASYPDVLFSIDENRYTIFHHAIMNRHVDIFNLIHIGSVKTVVTSFKDEQGNNMLHLSAMLAPPNRLNIVPGAALQLQRDLLWFEEMKEVINQSDSILLFENLKKVMEQHNVPEASPSTTGVQILLEEMKMVMDLHELNHIKGCKEEYIPRDSQLIRVSLLFKEIKKVMEQHELNQDNNLTEEYTPHELFIKEHKDLMSEGEKWMRDTANSCMIVAALITTIAFAAAITVPGGNADDGYPNFLKKLLFNVFLVADTVSLVSSATSLLDFLSILTARYTIDDFRWSLPNKLFIGLLTLFVSIVAMMVAFVLAIFIILEDTPPVFTVVVAVVSSVPIILFIQQHSGLFLDVFRSTYASYFLFKPKKNPSLLFKGKKKTREPLISLKACGKVVIDF